MTAQPLAAPAAATTQAEPERVLRVTEVAEHLDCNPHLVYRLIQRGDLRALRVGRLIRVPLSALNEYLATAA
ncbi:helix-turn-helix domain-containing protein [Micrococcus luteus]|uniref:helix-turn-helix domain-containing protein n=1 Tax=Micrococcus luteus TaxID=1270 RepID=UPI003411E2E2|nr:helix-turn-helix domain-containing protein [Micrococcus luteus]MCV7527936.1 helix-turn-helix domain-containing protein [Micrococcus luteus]MCV7700721.1 helix-turn-helix domain-containing protein [Micrococcus luteus]